MLRLFVIEQDTKKTKTNKKTFLTALKKALPSHSVSFLLENPFFGGRLLLFQLFFHARSRP
jgi:hypothetical protein